MDCIVVSEAALRVFDVVFPFLPIFSDLSQLLARSLFSKSLPLVSSVSSSLTNG